MYRIKLLLKRGSKLVFIQFGFNPENCLKVRSEFMNSFSPLKGQLNEIKKYTQPTNHLWKSIFLSQKKYIINQSIILETSDKGYNK